MVGEPSVLNGIALDFISDRFREPEWLLDKRQNAFQDFASTSFPEEADSPYERFYTNLGLFDFSSLRKPFSMAIPPESVSMVPQLERAGLIAFSDTALCRYEQSGDLSKKSLVFSDLRKAVVENEPKVRPYLFSQTLPSTHKLAAWHTAFFTSGVFLYVPKSTVIPQPLEASWSTNISSAGFGAHSLMVAEKDSEVTLVLTRRSPSSERSSFHTDFLEIIAREGSKVNVVSLFDWSPKSSGFSWASARLAKDASVNFYTGIFGCSKSINWIDSSLSGENSRGLHATLCSQAQGQQADVSSNAFHTDKGSSHEIRLRASACADAKVVSRGLIRIEKTADRTSSHMTANSILMGPKAQANATPSLEIDNNNVQCRHSASTSHIGDEQLFYLMSRGLDAESSSSLVLEGFFEPVLDLIPFNFAKDAFRKRLRNGCSHDFL